VPLPKYRPQLASLVERPPTGPHWLHELKFDGYRIACSLERGRVRLESRRNLDWTGKFPEIAQAVKALPVESLLLDGEVTIVAPSGVTSFQSLQNSFAGGSRVGLTYFAFDLLYLNGENIAARPLEARKRECERILQQRGEAGIIRYSHHFETDGAVLLAQACALGAEGIISKRRDQAYRPGRGDGWLKAKCVKQDEFVIGGFTEPGGTRSGIGALLLGQWHGGALRFAGKVGTGPGFTAAYLTRLRGELDSLEQGQCPFEPPPPGWIGRHGRWVRPVLAGVVTFTEWTDAGTLRHPSFQGFQQEASEPGWSAIGTSSTPRPHTAGAALRGAAGGVPEAVAGARGAKSRRPPAALPAAAPSAAVAAGALTSSERLVYPALGFSKRDLAQFYADVAAWMLPYVAHRPLTLVRCERGVRDADALRTECRFLPHEIGWYRWAGPPLRRVQIQEQKKVGEYLVLDSPEGLAALVQGDIVEVHCWNSTLDHLETPDRIVLDLDPGSGVTWSEVVAAARDVRALLTNLGLQCWPKLTGGAGVHIVIPFEPEHGWDAVYALAQRLAQAAAQRAPDRFTLDFAKQKRTRKILIDYKRNHRGAVAVAAYSARARPSGTVGVPVSWRELVATRPPERHTVQTVRTRLARLTADPWRDFWSCRQRLSR
jgi:bifunctional non-homologous end joining protein LigD